MFIWLQGVGVIYISEKGFAQTHSLVDNDIKKHSPPPGLLRGVNVKSHRVLKIILLVFNFFLLY